MYLYQSLKIRHYLLNKIRLQSKTLQLLKYLILTVTIVLLITMKYSMNMEGESDGDPVEVLVHEKAILIDDFFQSVDKPLDFSRGFLRNKFFCLNL